ncbi:hypothetical protein DPMN_059362 [Dreissena polymorpha]|uniref:Uncharacterized protein n=1 Tax=Dreissena polymorpha TaxID=45954 RepID=A0A9D4C3D6_DREPO|nr:hypothetical protein DPMN_059362 [Dreissena polymorpha]
MVATQWNSCDVTAILWHQLTTEHKWKMYMEVDEDGDDDSDEGLSIVTCIKDVTFTSPSQESFKVTHPPYIMDKWSVGVSSEMDIECGIVTVEIREKESLCILTLEVSGSMSFVIFECSVTFECIVNVICI